MNDNSQRWPSYAQLPPHLVEMYQQATNQGDFDLNRSEIFWRDIHSFVKERGYQFRPRYEVGWTPSWMGTRIDPFYCEDSIPTCIYNFIDAVVIRKPNRVGIKRVHGHANELEIARFIMSSNMLTNPRNHCVEILDIFGHPTQPDISFIVMPLLRPFDDPPFVFLGEVFDFLNQVLDGLAFMHENHIAHRDCAGFNIMMDGTALYPEGYHPMRNDFSPDAMRKVTPLPRIDNPVRYYFIDFGMSNHFPDDMPPYVVGNKGRDRDVPELSIDTPYNAYQADVHILANTIKKDILMKYAGVNSLEMLVRVMTEPNPAKRATALEALAICKSIQSHAKSRDKNYRRQRVMVIEEENTPIRLVKHTLHAARTTMRLLTGLQPDDRYLFQ